MKVTEEMILFAMERLLVAGNNFGHDTPEEIVWELNELQEKLGVLRAGNQLAPTSTSEQQMNQEIQNLNSIYQ